jgi:hypothetical protein
MHRLSPGFAFRITGQDLPATCQPVERGAACRLCTDLEMEDCRCHERRRGTFPCHPSSTFYNRPDYRSHRLLSPLTILSMSLTQERLKRRSTTLRAASPNSSNSGSLALPDDSGGDAQGVRARVCAISYIHASAKARWSSSRVLRSCASRWKAFA